MPFIQDLRNRLASPSSKTPPDGSAADPWQHVVANGQFLIAEIDKSALIRSANPAFCAVRGESEKKLIGTSLLYLISAGEREEFTTLYRGLFIGHPGGSIVARLLIEGEPLPTIRWTVLPKHNAAGEIESAMCVGIDVSEVFQEAVSSRDTSELGDLRQAKMHLEKENEALRLNSQHYGNPPADAPDTAELDELRLASQRLEEEAGTLRAEVSQLRAEAAAVPEIDPWEVQQLRESKVHLTTELEALRRELDQRTMDAQSAPAIDPAEFEQLRESRAQLTGEVEALRRELEEQKAQAAAAPPIDPAEHEQLRESRSQLAGEVEALRRKLEEQKAQAAAVPAIDPAEHEKLRAVRTRLAAEVEGLRHELKEREVNATPRIIAEKLEDIRETQRKLTNENESLKADLERVLAEGAALPEAVVKELEELREYQALLEEDNELLRAKLTDPDAEQATPPLPGLHTLSTVERVA